jgi:hypothetical protein
MGDMACDIPKADIDKMEDAEFTSALATFGQCRNMPKESRDAIIVKAKGANVLGFVTLFRLKSEKFDVIVPRPPGAHQHAGLHPARPRLTIVEACMTIHKSLQLISDGARERYESLIGQPIWILVKMQDKSRW